MTGDWRHMSNDHDNSHISMRKVGELFKYYARGPEGFETSFDLARFRGQYGAADPEGDAFCFFRRSSFLAEAIGSAGSMGFLAMLILGHSAILRM